MASEVSLGRRRFLGYTLGGLTGVALGGLGIRASLTRALATPSSISLSFEEALVQMVDQEPVYHWLFRRRGDALPGFPGPVIVATEGDEIEVVLTNNLDEDHAFEVLRAPGTSSGPIAPGDTRTVTFVAPAAGTYLYLDPLNAPVNRVMGLHGALVVLPRGVQEHTAVNTPYTRPTPNVQRLFDDLGNTPHFPGDPWIPIRPGNVPPDPHLPADIEPFLFRTRIWLFTQVDPVLNGRIQALAPGVVFDAARFQRDFLPRYFLINGQSGAFAAHDHATLLEGFIGEPHLVRQLDAGLAAPSNHLHSNHFYVLAIDNEVQDNVTHPDTMTLAPAQTRLGDRFFTGGSTVDWLVPFIRPPDIPGDPNRPLRDLIPQELSLVLGGVPQSPLRYPMHDHSEQSQTAAGGNYPQGDVTDIVFLGDLDKVPFPQRVVAAGGRRGSAESSNTDGSQPSGGRPPARGHRH